MEKNTEKKSTNVVGARKIQTKDGSALAITTLSMLPVNCEVNSKTLSDGAMFLNFKSSVFGDFGIKKLAYALNGADLDVDKTYGSVSANVSIYVSNPKQTTYYLDKIKKGSQLRIVQAEAKVDKKYGLQLTIKGGDISFIKDPEDKKLSPKVILDDGPAYVVDESEFPTNPFLD
jgi:hypothetical protein